MILLRSIFCAVLAIVLMLGLPYNAAEANTYASDVRIVFSGDFKAGPALISFVLNDVATSVVVRIKHKAIVVRTINVGSLSRGEHTVAWDGMSDKGEIVKARKYSAEIETIGGNDDTVWKIFYDSGETGMFARGVDVNRNPTQGDFGFMYAANNGGGLGRGILRLRADGAPAGGDTLGGYIVKETIKYWSGPLSSQVHFTTIDWRGWVWVSNPDSGKISVYRPNDKSITPVINGLKWPMGLAVSGTEADFKLYVAADTYVFRYNLGTRIIASAPDTVAKLGARVIDLVLDDDNFLYVNLRVGITRDGIFGGGLSTDKYNISNQLPITRSDTLWSVNWDASRPVGISINRGTDRKSNVDDKLYVSVSDRVDGIYEISTTIVGLPRKTKIFEPFVELGGFNLIGIRSDLTVDVVGNVIFFENNSEHVFFIAPPGVHAYTTLSNDLVVTTPPNQRPILVNAIPNQTISLFDSSPFNRDLNASPVVFTDPDRDTLTYEAISSALDVATVNMSGSVLTIIPVATGSTEIIVTALDEGDSLQFTKFSLTVTTNRPPVIIHTNLSTLPAGKDAVVDAIITDDISVVNSTLNYRKGGDSHFTSRVMIPTGNIYQSKFSADEVTPNGVEYFITASDTFNKITKVPVSGFFSVQVIVPAGVEKEGEQPSGSEQNAYRLISMPLDLDNKSAKVTFANNLGSLYNKKKWRLFTLNTAEQKYVEFPDFADTVKMAPAKAFLLIVKDAGKFISAGAGKSYRTDKFFAIPLQPRWNFVGNPFNFPIPLDHLSVKSGKNFPLRYHEGTWRDPFLNKVSEIKPFEGYAVFNTLEVVDTLLINPDLSSSTSSLAKEFASTVEEKMVWSIRIHAQCQEALDEDNTAAVVSGASSNWDELDQPEPPGIGEYVSVYFSHPEWNKLAKTYCTDVRPMTSDNGHRTSDGEIWPFEVKTNISDKVNLTFEGIDEVPKELEVWLVDDALKITQNLRENNHYAVAGSEQPKPLKLVVGKRDFVGEKLADAQAIPATYELSQNFPNPFNPATTIRYGLPQAGRVTLKIYNLLGAEVARLINDEPRAAGYHAAIWDGRNHAGKVVASGVYIYRLQVYPELADPEPVEGFVQTRKMILLQ